MQTTTKTEPKYVSLWDFLGKEPARQKLGYRVACLANKHKIKIKKEERWVVGRTDGGKVFRGYVNMYPEQWLDTVFFDNKTKLKYA